MSYTGTIIADPRTESFVSDSFKLLLESVANYYNLKIIYSYKVLRCDVEGRFVMLYNLPNVNYPYCGTMVDTDILFDNRLRLVYFMRDLHGVNDKYRPFVSTIMRKADIIIGHNYEHFCDNFQEYKSKYRWLPQFFAPTRRYKNLPNTLLADKERYCLVPGMRSQAIYPLRFLATMHNQCKTLGKHPAYSKLSIDDISNFVVRDKYAKVLNRYACCLTDCSKYGYFLQKHVEIPASGSLLLTDKCLDLTLAGFESGKHYIEIDDKNLCSVIHDVLYNPSAYQEIADNAKNLVFKYYTLEQTASKMVSMIKEII